MKKDKLYYMKIAVVVVVTFFLVFSTFAMLFI